LPVGERSWCVSFRRGLSALAVAILLSHFNPIAGPLSGGPFAVVGSAGGGGTSSGGGFVLNGWVASAGAGTSSGEEFDLTCGLVGVYVVPGEDLALKVEVTGDGLVRIWWSPDLVGYQLESTAALGSGAGWLPVEPPAAGSSYMVEPAGPARFFRLRRP
jgi:hypothetical protein